MILIPVSSFDTNPAWTGACDETRIEGRMSFAPTWEVVPNVIVGCNCPSTGSQQRHQP